MSAPPPPPRVGMSLYANLLESDTSASISRDPVVFPKDDTTAPAKKHIVDPALRFQPIRRPQPKQPGSSKPKPAAFPKPTTIAPAARTTTTLADWSAAVDDADIPYEKKKLARGGRKQKKRKKVDTGERAETNWDDIYDPARPTNVDEYLRSDERIAEIREWKGVLYAHRRRRTSTSDEDDDRQGMGMGMSFAPPTSLSFAPPPLSPSRVEAATGDDAYARRLALSGAPAESGASIISRAPVRYEAPPPPHPPAAADDDDTTDGMDIDPPTTTTSTNRPGQQNFAARLMAKYGWTRGSGLGASSSGITTALRVQVEKKRQGPGSGGGGRGKIIASKSKHTTIAAAGTAGEKGKASTVVLLGNMLSGMADVEAEVEAGLGQEIGEECGERYGRVERVVVVPAGSGSEEGAGAGAVFIKFVEGVSALRAVNALEGRVFNGNVIVPRFYDEERFERGEYVEDGDGDT